jgi:predicted ATP-grasp superfamily ATP-dependent carboligase
MSVVLTDGFWPKTLVAARCLHEDGERVVCGEQTRLAPALWSKATARRFVHADPFRFEERFVARLESILTEETSRGPVVLMPMEEETLLVVLRHRERLARHAAIPFASAVLIERLRDKRLFGELARAHGLPTPRTRSFRDEPGLRAAAAELGFPVVIKRRVSSGARGVDYAADAAELLAYGRAALALDPEPLLQERLPAGGEAIGVSLLLWPDAAGAGIRCHAGFVHRRLREYPGTGGSSTLREPVRDDALVERCASFLAALGFTGVAMLEWKRDLRDGELKLLECNPRFWGSLHQAVLCGVRFPTLLARLARGESIAPLSSIGADGATGSGGGSMRLRSRALFPGDLLHWWKARPRPRGFFARSPDVVDELFRRDDLLPAAVKAASFVPLLTCPGLRRLAFRPAPHRASR